MAKKQPTELERENQQLRRIAADLQWMARRYSDGRGTYAPVLLNDHTDTLLSLGVELNLCGEEKIYARDEETKIAGSSTLRYHRELREQEIIEEYRKRRIQVPYLGKFLEETRGEQNKGDGPAGDA